MVKEKSWNKCDVCGRFIGFADLESELAHRKMITPDTAFTSEEYETLCKKHNLERLTISDL